MAWTVREKVSAALVIYKALFVKGSEMPHQPARVNHNSKRFLFSLGFLYETLRGQNRSGERKTRHMG